MKQIELNTIYNEDCFEGMKRVESKSVDMILCDLPYGMTDCDWDVVLPFDKLWAEYKRIIKDNGVVVLTASQPFTSLAVMSNLKMFRYSWIWEKESGTNFLHAKRHPLKVHEDILVFYRNKSEILEISNLFNEVKKYLLAEREKTKLSDKEMKELLGSHMGRHYFSASQWSFPSQKDYCRLQETGFFKMPYEELRQKYNQAKEKIDLRYYPQMTEGKPYKGRNSAGGNLYKLSGSTIKKDNTGLRYPRSVLKVNRQTGLHPTQKPVELFEYLIKTYTKEGETVLDHCMGSGTTAIAAINTNRKFIGFETDRIHFEKSIQRIQETHIENE